MVISAMLLLAAVIGPPDLERARDRQDRPALERLVSEYGVAAGKQTDDARAQYALALGQSYLAEVAMELRNKDVARAAAEAGIVAARKAVALNPETAEYHRVLGTLCGQVIPANVFAGLKYGRCALDSIDKAIELDPNSAIAHVSRGVGNYYLPPAFGGGPELAIRDLEKAIQLDPNLPEAHLWLGIAQRKLNRNTEARAALGKALKLNPDRIWIRQQLEKTPAQ
jgi:tetratricopeptide (TPR) repeat protein